MAGKMYVTKGYSTYTDIPSRRGGYDHGTENPINQYAVETKTIERVRAPASGYTDFVGSPSKIELLKEYVHSPGASPKHASTKNHEGYDPNHGLNFENSSSPKYQNEGSWPKKTSHFSSSNKYHPSSPVHSYHSEKTHLTESGPGFVGASHPNQSWQSVGPPNKIHPLTTSTNNINEALGFLESVAHSPRSDSRRGGVLDELSTRAQPVEPQKRYARPAFVSKSNEAYKRHY